MSTQQTILPNGLTVVTDTMPNMNSVSMGIWVKAGARNERLEQNGIAHFLEHMMFKGTDTRGPKTIAQEIEVLGGRVNAYTSKNITAYYVQVLKDKVEPAFDVIADIVFNSNFPQDELDAEREVIIQEIKRSQDSPQSKAYDLISKAQYSDHSMGRTILGPEENIRNFTRENFFEFVETFYHPDNMIVSAAGAVDHDEFAKLVQNRLGHILNSKLIPKVDAPTFNEGDARELGELTQAHVYMAIKGPDAFSDDLTKADLYSIALGGGMSSRLFQTIREKNSLCYTISAGLSTMDNTGSLMIYSGTGGEGNVEKLTSLTMDEIKKSVGDISQEELDKCKAVLKSNTLMSLDSNSGQARSMAHEVAVYGFVEDADEVEQRIDEVTVEDINSYAESFVENAELALALYGKIDLDKPSLAELKERLVG